MEPNNPKMYRFRKCWIWVHSPAPAPSFHLPGGLLFNFQLQAYYNNTSLNINFNKKKYYNFKTSMLAVERKPHFMKCIKPPLQKIPIDFKQEAYTVETMQDFVIKLFTIWTIHQKVEFKLLQLMRIDLVFMNSH